jgi:hypothetical protein
LLLLLLLEMLFESGLSCRCLRCLHGRTQCHIIPSALAVAVAAATAAAAMPRYSALAQHLSSLHMPLNVYISVCWCTRMSHDARHTNHLVLLCNAPLCYSSTLL